MRGTAKPILPCDADRRPGNMAMRLVIDARMLDHSGIGIYLNNVLPGVLQRCTALRPLLLTLPRLLPKARAIAGSVAEACPWTAAPLSIGELAPPPEAGPH